GYWAWVEAGGGGAEGGEIASLVNRVKVGILPRKLTRRMIDFLEADAQAFAQDLGGPEERVKRDARVVRIEEAVDLRTARVHAARQLGLVELPRHHLALHLPGDDALDRGLIDLVEDALLFEEALEAAALVDDLPHLRFSMLLLRSRAVVRSACEVDRLFLMKP